MAQLTNIGGSTGYPYSRKVVFIGADPPMLKAVTLSIHLRWPDVTPVVADTAMDGLELVEQLSPNAVLIGTLHPDTSPPAVVEEIRSFSGVPIVVLSRNGDEMEAVTSLELGADDYIRFPCGMLEIMARVWGSMRRVGAIACRNENGPTIMSGDLLINPSTYEVFMSEQRIGLTATEFRLLHLLAKNRGVVVSHQSIEHSVWADREFNPQVAKKYVQRLRQKLGDCAAEPRWIASVPGVGYRFIGPKPCQQHVPVQGGTTESIIR
jgi:two-component system KDP operon response regulator KdpE